ncbi:MAG: pyrimidine dimer DNA glycosylase/endonuclease V [Flavobacteriaceae bacterium]
MRIWSLHPKYLDAKGLVALWRETLLAKHVLEGKTKGYKNHPQLDRFKEQNNSLDCINCYLSEVYKEATQRGYNFDKSKISWDFKPAKIPVTSGQVAYETKHLLNKLKTREPNRYKEVSSLSTFEPHPIFTVVKGDIEAWEII